MFKGFYKGHSLQQPALEKRTSLNSSFVAPRNVMAPSSRHDEDDVW
jgi:hypothetical protein